ncbi:hypothetical protein BAL199_19718 [alpha proteobacterium BAL199]|jgi:hypothetical protein|nr:hypothetical protein BAL199_19718 [alpha proteobacterium BAL199]
MLVDTLPMRLAFWLGRPARLDAVPDISHDDTLPALYRSPLRPAIDAETRLMLHDRGWRP